jgi:hypothetical protein
LIPALGAGAAEDAAATSRTPSAVLAMMQGRIMASSRTPSMMEPGIEVCMIRMHLFFVAGIEMIERVP